MSSETRDVIDSRDLIERLEELMKIMETPGLIEEDELEELNAILDLEGAGIADWEYGATLIHRSYFQDYARELAEDVGAIPSDAGWPCHCIDWERAARELAMDYSLVSYLGEYYYVRS